VLLKRPGIEVERMTPMNAAQALYSDILDKPTVDHEYGLFSGILKRWTDVYYVKDILEVVLQDETVRQHLVSESLRHDRRTSEQQSGEGLFNTLMSMDSGQLARVLIEGYEKEGWDGYSDDRYLLRPLFNLFFTRDASSTVYDRVLINSMSFEVRERETLIYEAIFRHFFGVELLNASSWNPLARTEGGDIHVASPDLLCIGEGIRTNAKGIDYLAQTFARERDHFNILVQELPKEPESFIHLDMVFTFLGPHSCMAYEPLIRKSGIFAGKRTTIISSDNGKVTTREMPNILEALKACGIDLEPIFCGGDDEWAQKREQWHSGANFFALGEDHIIGYRRNPRTIDALARAGYHVLPAEEVVDGGIDPFSYDKCVVTFAGSELPRGGGGARCMTCPINREETEY
jgi:arginine deiminase